MRIELGDMKSLKVVSRHKVVPNPKFI